MPRVWSVECRVYLSFSSNLRSRAVKRYSSIESFVQFQQCYTWRLQKGDVWACGCTGVVLGGVRWCSYEGGTYKGYDVRSAVKVWHVVHGHCHLEEHRAVRVLQKVVHVLIDRQYERVVVTVVCPEVRRRLQSAHHLAENRAWDKGGCKVGGG